MEIIRTASPREGDGEVVGVRNPVSEMRQGSSNTKSGAHFTPRFHSSQSSDALRSFTIGSQMWLVLVR